MNPFHAAAGSPGASTIIDTLAGWHARTPDRTALRILRDGEEVAGSISFGKLYRQAMRIAGELRRQYRPRTRVLLLLPSSIEFAEYFFGCLAAGMIAVPVNYPAQSRKRSQWARLQAIADDCAAELLLVTARTAENLRQLRAEAALFNNCAVVDVAEFAAQLSAGDEAPGVNAAHPDEVAYLQYTSGTTAQPKGVMITHANLMDNQRVIVDMMHHHPDLPFGSWLPLYHDMGLAAILQLGSVGLGVTLMSPMAFVQKPLRWLQMIHDYRIGTSGGPNFAYELAARELASDAADGLDLSSWEVAFCGAEPIRGKTVADFLTHATRRGFRPPSFYPCYGLAESTLAVTGIERRHDLALLDVDPERLGQGRLEPRPAEAGGAKRLVGCGYARAGNEVRIVDPERRIVCGPGEIGEIWIRGGSVGAGYWNNPAASEETFSARLADDTGPFLRTGDLGAIHNGQLYITGRAKDMVIIRGRNLYPQDIELIVQHSYPGLSKDCGAAFGVTRGDEEQLVIVQEVGRTALRNFDADAAFTAIRAAVIEEFAVTPAAIVLIQPATIAKTSSGKLQRRQTQRHYLAGELQVVARWTDPGLTADSAAVTGTAAAVAARLTAGQFAHRIAAALASQLKIDPGQISCQTPWAELGLDSVGSVRLVQTLQDEFGVRLESTVLWDHANVDELAGYLARQADHRAPAAAPPAASPVVPLPPDLDQIAKLSEEEATALLLAELDR